MYLADQKQPLDSPHFVKDGRIGPLYKFWVSDELHARDIYLQGINNLENSWLCFKVSSLRIKTDFHLFSNCTEPKTTFAFHKE